MSDESNKFVREESPVQRRRGARRRAAASEEGDDAPRERRHGRVVRGKRGIRDEIYDLNRGAAYVGIEGIAAGVDIATRVLRNSVDRAFNQNYRNPGDLLRGVGRDIGDTAHDVIDGVKEVPNRLNDSFYEAVPRAEQQDRGERYRRAQEERTGDDEE